ncbi:MAG: hypothetical protein JW742_08585, partial [Candidatus Aminicenantes bacterium]|nr:hypothetical protein [Candidatus Aminicenantes bacterium]
ALPEGWTNPIDLCPNLQYWSHEARIATDAKGIKVYAVWIEEGGGGKRIYFNSNERGEWGVAHVIHAPLLIGEYPGPKVALDVLGDGVVSFQARMANGNYEMVFRKRVYGEWKDLENASRTETGGSVPGGIMVDPNTNDYYICFQDDWERPYEDATYWGVYLVRKPLGTFPWAPAGRVPDVSNRSYFPDGRINAKSRGFIIWDNRATFAGSLVFFSENKNLLDTAGWTAPVDISGNTGTVDNFGFSYPRLDVDDQNNVYVSWLQNTGNWETFFRKRLNGKWMVRENISKTEGKSAHSTVAVNRKTGEIYVAWSEDTLKGVFIYMSIFTNQNEQKKWRWSEAINMTPDAQTSDYPTLFADANGGIHLAYTSNKSGAYHIWYTAKLGDVAGLPPVNVTATSLATAADPRKKDTTVAWEKNPLNESVPLESYKIYRKKKDEPDTAYAPIGVVDDQVFLFKDPGLLGVQVFSYKVSSIAKGELESEASEPAEDELVPPPIFPPANPAVTTVLSDDISKKENTLTWEKNGLNRPDELAAYRIYRKEAQQDDSAYILAAEVEPNVFRLEDEGLANDRLYTYASSAYSIYDRESPRSASLTDIRVYAPTYPPSSPALSTRLQTASGAKLNILTWQENSQNLGLPIQSIRIYRKADNAAAFTRVGAVDGRVRLYEDPGLPTARTYSYKLSSVPSWGIESAQTGVLVEDRLFPPVDVFCETRRNAFFLHTESINRLTWAENPLNRPVTVTAYKIYRKRAAEDDAAFVLLTTVGAAVFEHLDRGLPAGAAFVYRIVTVDDEGNESAPATAYGES